MGLEPTVSTLTGWRALQLLREGVKDSSGGRTRTSELLVQGQVLLPSTATPDRCIIRTRERSPRFGEEGSNLHRPASKAGGLPVSQSPRVPRGSRTRLSGLEDRCLRRSARSTRATQRKERESNPQGLSLDCFRNSCRRRAPTEGWSCLPFRPCRKLRWQESNLRRGA